jgi:phosphoribosylanthranilate isomerase
MSVDREESAVMTAVKICGLSSAETMKAALDAGADMVGLVFFEKSPRNVSFQDAKELAGAARGKARIVALVVDAHDEMLKRVSEVIRPDLIQAHGSETPERIADIKVLTKIPVIKAIKVATAADIAKAKAYDGIAEMMLYDAKAPETLKDALPGGNGLAFEWSLLGKDAGMYILAGGLTPDNVAEAISLTGAPVVDVSSGVESAPGIKDASKIRKFIEAAKSAR